MSLHQYSSLTIIMEPSVEIGPPSHDWKPYSNEMYSCCRIQKPIAKYPIMKAPCFEKEEIPVALKYPVIKPIFLNPSSPVVRKERYNKGEWTEEEHKAFVEGYKKYKRNWSLIARTYVFTRTRQQVRNHAVKYFLRMEKSKSDSE
eukprot:gene7162-11475_t